jgi:hypothetical protein
MLLLLLLLLAATQAAALTAAATAWAALLTPHCYQLLRRLMPQPVAWVLVQLLLPVLLPLLDCPAALAHGCQP